MTLTDFDTHTLTIETYTLIDITPNNTMYRYVQLDVMYGARCVVFITIPWWNLPYVE